MCTVPLAAAAMRCLESAAKAGGFFYGGRSDGPNGNALNDPETRMPSGKGQRVKFFVGCPEAEQNLLDVILVAEISRHFLGFRIPKKSHQYPESDG